MKISKRQKIMVGLVALGVAVVVFDRMQDSPPVFNPKTAAAAAVPAGAVSAQPAAPAAQAGQAAHAAPAALAIPAPPERQSTVIARQLADLGGSNAQPTGELRDIFQPGAPWVIAAPEPAPPPQAASPMSATSDDFTKKHKLQAILSSGGEWIAVINFKNLRVGDTCWEDYKVTAITGQTVTLRSGEVSVTLELKK